MKLYLQNVSFCLTLIFTIIFSFTYNVFANGSTDRYPLVTFEDILENPEVYNNHRVKIHGYMNIRYNWYLLLGPTYQISEKSVSYEPNAEIILKRELFDFSKVEIEGIFLKEGSFYFGDIISDISKIKRLDQKQQPSYKEILEQNEFLVYPKDLELLGEDWEAYTGLTNYLGEWIKAVKAKDKNVILKNFGLYLSPLDILLQQEVERELNRKGSRINWVLFSNEFFNFNELGNLNEQNFGIFRFQYEENGNAEDSYFACFCREENCQENWPTSFSLIIRGSLNFPYECLEVKEVGLEDLPWRIDYSSLMPYPG